MPEVTENTPSLNAELSPTSETKPAICRMLMSKTDLPLYEEIGPKYDIHLATISGEGEQYTHFSEDFETQRQTSYTGKVPEGKIYGELSSARRNWTDFWKEFEAKQQTSSVKG